MQTIALLGGGPAALFMYKRIVEAKLCNYTVHIFEKHEKLGAGLPYSKYGASKEHITNVSSNEIPSIKTSVKDWISQAPKALLRKFDMDEISLNEYKVLPRLLFGEYLEAQFNLLQKEAKKAGIQTVVHLNSEVVNVLDNENAEKVNVILKSGEKLTLDKVIICTGHSFPRKKEKKVKGWFDSPYPPEKLALQVNYKVAIRGASLTAIDAVRTMARANGKFTHGSDGVYTYHLSKKSKGFKIKLFSLGGLLPGVRIHLEDTRPDPSDLLSEDEIKIIKNQHKGFIPLDYVYDQNFRKILQEKQPDLYKESKGMAMEEFMEFMMDKRKKTDPMRLFRQEYEEAEQSIETQESIIWKETLADLSYVINYAIKHFSAEDMLRYKRSLQPLISLIIAFVPQSSAREILALHNAGVLELVDVDKNSLVKPSEKGGCIYSYGDKKNQKKKEHFKMFIDALGQMPFYFKKLPFNGLIHTHTLSPAYLNFADQENAIQEFEEGNKEVHKDVSGVYLLHLPGISINDYFQPLNQYGVANKRIYVMAVPYISGLNPDYSGLDFCEVASQKILDNLTDPYHRNR
ncbi:FAD/NAD(P)-binding protein [Algoriphagus winogradskyi]|uniref:Uncharacterized NAD(P)/FAD-binding protein YdhS n=1 Tax=Algoriphagus winogradskyi TaxID=237017 RepID=A0ABY1NBF0_9BACT|nr:FAD/NAD(P)-binding protein [Algoriphagus winogradskyi]SMP05664.1 Uncharacterized NAD(P)/FAD-binding protein YdhS [Algoriphagus winogradskyi]